MPSRAMQTMMPANRTARPEVLTALTIDVSAISSGDQALSMSGHDEQGVVDAHAQADQEHQRGRELRHLHDVAEQPDQAHGGAERGQGRDEGQGHGEERPEDEQQHDAGQEHADPGPAEGRPVRLLGQLARHRHLEARGCRPTWPCSRGRWRRRSRGSGPAGRTSPWRRRPCSSLLTWVAPSRPVGRDDVRDVGHLGHLGQHGVDAGLDGRVGHLGAPDVAKTI